MPCERCLCCYAVSVCVCLSVTLVHSVKKINISSIFFTVGYSHQSSLSIPNLTAIFRRGPPNASIECRWGRQKSRFWASNWLHRVLSTLRPARCYKHGAAGPWQVVTLIAGSKRRSLLMAGDDDEMFTTRTLSATPKTTEQHLTARSDY